MTRLAGRKPQRPGGAAAFGGPGAQGPPGLPNKKAGAGGKASPLLFRALRAPPPPPRTPTPSPSPTPAHLRRPYGSCPGDAGRMGRTRGAAAFGGPGAQGPPGLPNKKAGAGGKASPLLFRALRAPPPPPRTPTPSPSPTPAHLRRPYGGCPWEAGGWDGPGGAFPQRQKAAKKEAVKPPSRSVVFNMGP